MERAEDINQEQKFIPLDYEKFFKLIFKSQPTDVPIDYEIIYKIDNTLGGEDFQSQTSDVIGMLTENNLNETIIVPNQIIRFKSSDELPSSVQFVVIPYEDFE
ncbi:hypothetical protein AVEN_271787-1 [Araneus ventricosus]|uniref:Uncharacterized protein n=1 Tax=Araneus ventricosus TaxID=182803 RepID=A0A4Y2IG85_ARAVE|nr:hypothetical protein AVEN_271787-1 [Araneus ventricosus]